MKNQKLDKTSKFIYLRNGNNIMKVDFSDILYVTVEGRYLKICYKDKSTLHLSSLKSFTDRFSSELVKIHQSFAVNKDKVDYINVKENKLYLKCGLVFPINRSFRKTVINNLLK